MLALAAAAQGVVLAERVAGEVLPHEDAAEIRVVAEADAVHVVDLALGPLGAGPEVAGAVDLECGVGGDAAGVERGLEEALDGDAALVLVGLQEVDDREAPRLLDGVLEVVDRRDIGEEVVVEARTSLRTSGCLS